MAIQTPINQLEMEMSRLGWTSQHPRIQKFLLEAALLTKSPKPDITALSDKYIIHLTKLIRAYWECQNVIQIISIDWKDPEITSIFQKYGYGNRMPLKGWSELVKALDQRWFDSGLGF